MPLSTSNHAAFSIRVNDLPGLAFEREAADAPDTIGTLGNALLQQGAQLLVMRQMLLAICAHAPTALKSEITRTFRLGVEDVLSRTDDLLLPATFSSTLMGEYNAFMNQL